MIRLTLIIEFPGTDHLQYLRPLLAILQKKQERVLLCMPSPMYHSVTTASELDKSFLKCLEIHEGCLCCNPKNVIDDLLEENTRTPDYDRIIIISTGFFISEQVLRARQSEKFNNRISFESTVAVLDMAYLARLTQLWPPGIVWLISQAARIVLLNLDCQEVQRNDELIAKISSHKEGDTYSLMHSAGALFMEK